ncbi:SIT4 phosphatase-associated protein-domain-containing protein [Gamsiella multidivaricata]|uniref:SIT4 phosphatase-associated protein-domain-containing protein n=1 Tax=Gamsiella multidivaricata TaxID=101098 RepID=UPI002220EC35|nr:SIT4 phosphatase-associated protein-domain-containing protein [Gamsiella multidivaricata]KAG0367781.1 hypothetical protein BGZ54_003241 [Gamsiella multidivaricata]KAI7832397.1 SIT4 phosphatase-associated protein-domain-containing protein [Gamsiella multidivaricata]
MYWRFGHQNASVIDHLLESGNVSLEELLEQDDLIQECKAQNPKLIEYLRDPKVLQQLLSYITSDDLEDRARFKYPFIACEVIACEVWGIFESALSNIDILVKFWEFLDRPPPLNPVQASYFAKVIGVFLMKKTSEMLEFIKSQPEVVPKLLLHMSTSAIMDLLLKIISMEESPEGKGTVQWLSEQGLMPWLVNRLDPNFDTEVHSIASQVLLDIIAISQSSHPEQPSIGTNVLIDELKSEVLVSQLVGFMLDRDAPYSSSTLISGVTIFIELIRRNNSDYDVEPLPPGSTEPVREAVDLSDLLKVLASRIEDFKNLLNVPRSVTGPIDTSIGKQTPLGFERLKICELFAELLHCSNMAVLNSRPIISVSPDGTVKVPTVSINCVAQEPTEGLNGKMVDTDEKENGKVEQNRGRMSAETQNGTSTLTGSSGNDLAATNGDLATPMASPPLRPATATLTSSTIAALTTNHTQDDVLIPVGDFLKLQFVDYRIIPTCFDLFFQFPWNNFLHTVVYDMVHQVFHRPMGDIGRPDVDGSYIPPKSDVDITEGWNRRLTISIFKDGQLTKRITDAQRLNDYECAQPKGVRLGYMGHLTYIADETVKLLELYSQTTLFPTLYEYIDLEDWWNYVSKILKETKERDAQVLGGTRPNVIESHKSGLDDGNDDDYMDDNDDEYGSGNDFLGGGSGTGHEGDVASDQFARYLCQQITNNLPDKFGSSDEDEDDEDGNWIGEYGAENEFDMRRTGAPDVMGDPFGTSHGMVFDSDDEEGVDEETWNAPWPNMIAENKTAEQSSATQLSANLTESSERSQSDSAGMKMAPPPDEESNEKDIATALPDVGTAPEESRQDTKGSAVAIPATQHPTSTTPPLTTANSAATTTDKQDTHDHGEPSEITVLVSSSSTSSPAAVNEVEGNVLTQDVQQIQMPYTEVSARGSNSLDLQPVALAPEVQETPVIKGTLGEEDKDSSTSTVSSAPLLSSDSSSANSISSTAVEPPSTPASSLSSADLFSAHEPESVPVEMEVVHLANPSEPKLVKTSSVDSAPQSQSNLEIDTRNVKDDNEVTKVQERVGALDLEKRG